MSISSLHKYIQTALAILSGIFILALALEMTWSLERETDPAMEEGRSVPDTDVTRRADDSDTPSVGSYAAITERPLFMEDRRPYQPEPEESPETANQQPSPETRTRSQENYTLSAVIINGDQRTALIKPEKNDKTESYREGDMLDGWTIAGVERDRVTLERGAQSRILELKVATSKGNVSRTEAPQTDANDDAGNGDQQGPEESDTQAENQLSAEARRREELPENREIFDLYNNPANRAPATGQGNQGD